MDSKNRALPFTGMGKISIKFVALGLLFCGISAPLTAHQTTEFDKKQSLSNKQSDILQETINFETTRTTTNANPWLFLHPYSAIYKVVSDGNDLGQAIRRLQLQDDQWELSSTATLSKYFVKLKNFESSKFEIENKKLITNEFLSKTKITFKKEKKMKQIFDWDNGIEIGSRGKKKWRLTHDETVFDRVSHLLQLRADLIANKAQFIYQVSYKGKLQTFQYINELRESLSTELGKMDTIKLTRTKSNGDIFSLWLSPSLNYFPVKIAQLEKDKAEVIMILKSLEYVETTIEPYK
ncbi:MAG: DUF3108 domain-containing protein [Kangiellaceae bacterium]|nr:DUF3108 domain-containing protein [Kangiellaceae bacterium]